MTTYVLGSYVHYARKALINVVGLAGALLAEGLVPKPYDHYISIGIAVVTVVTHYSVSNAAAPGQVPAVDDTDESDDADVYVPTGPSEEDVADVAAVPTGQPVLGDATVIDVDALRDRLVVDVLRALGAVLAPPQTTPAQMLPATPA